MKKERWLPVVGHEGRYEVSDLGRVRSRHKGRAGVLKQCRLQGGYYVVWLYPSSVPRSARLVSRLVLEAFVGLPPTAKHQAAHGDGDIGNNALSNLRWATPSENNQDKRRHGTVPDQRGARGSNAWLTAVDVERIRDLRRTGCTMQQISDWIGTTTSNVSYILTGRTWRDA